MHPQIQFLLDHAATASPFASTAGQAFVSLPLGAFGHQVCSILSPRFRDWLIDAFYREHNQPPSHYALRQTIRTLEARALTSAPCLSVHRRVAARGDPRRPDSILLDLANPEGEIIEITPLGWQIATDPAAAFLHSRGNAELPRPSPSSQPPSVERLLPPLFNFATEADRTRLAAWLLSALRPTRPHPILALDGPTGSGKTTCARMLRALIDPAAAPLLMLPASVPELIAAAQHNWILAFDHVSQIRTSLSQALCRLATGTAIFHREKGDLREPLPLELHRPIILTTAPGWNPDETFASRTITVCLAPLTAATRRTESDLWAQFEPARPEILAALCDSLAAALANQALCRLQAVPRHADTAHWAAAAFPHLQTPIIDALNETLTTPILDAVASLIDQQSTWTGTATDLLHEISVTSVTAHLLSHHLRCHRDLLESKGIRLTFTRVHGGSRLIRLARSAPHVPPPTSHNPLPTPTTCLQ